MLVYNINPQACAAFLQQYPAIKSLIDSTSGSTLLMGYRKFLRLKNRNETLLGGTPETRHSDRFGTATFYYYNWGDCTGWAELYQYCKIREKYQSCQKEN